MSSRIVIVSNRLPVTVTLGGEGAFTLDPSTGGLATALRSVTQGRETLWIGWTGLDSPADERVTTALRERRLRGVDLSAAEVESYYDGFSNGVLWPLFHYLIDKIDFESRDGFKAYETVNQRFAEAAAEAAAPGDTVWVHDYQLALVPQMLRKLRPDLTIGYFLHIPFPSEDVFRILPWRAPILRGMLAADVVGFHTDKDTNHFVATCAQVLGISPSTDAIFFEGRTVRVGTYPIGIDAAEVETLAKSDAVVSRAEEIRASANGRTIVLGIDRLDYTKGIRARLRAYEELLERRPDLRDQVQLVQVAVPSRGSVPAYADFQKTVHAVVGRVNGKHGSVAHTPIVFLNRALSADEVTAFYGAADVMLVTPLRDGMNLVAKEYVASRHKEDGVLILSEFAGAAAELPEALLVNPYDTEAMGTAIERALVMPSVEARVRMRAMRRRVLAYDVKRWCDAILADLDDARTAPLLGPEPAPDRPSSPTLSALATAPSLCVLLDYDGTLVPLASVPELAEPDDELVRLLRTLGERPSTHVCLVSSRRREDLERWFGSAPLGLYAEHGYWCRERPGAEWQTTMVVSTEWKAPVLRLLEGAARRTVGSFVEEKTASVAWHYRNADPELAVARVRDLRARLGPLAGELGVQVLDASKALEVRVAGLSKAVAVARIRDQLAPETSVVAFGDDRADEDMFRALPDAATTVHVGPGVIDVGLVSSADFHVAGPSSVRTLLSNLLG